MTHYVDTRQPSSLATPVVTSGLLNERSGHGEKARITHELGNLAWLQLGYSHFLGPSLPTAETNAELKTWHHSLGLSSSHPGGRWSTLDGFQHGRGSVLSFLEQTLAWDMDLPSFHTMLLPNYHSCIHRIPHPQHGFLHSIASDLGIHFTPKEVWQWAHARRINWFFHVHHSTKSAGLMEWWKGLSKLQLQC